MIKTASLRAHLEASPVLARHLRHDPANLRLDILAGAVRAAGARGSSFEYVYEATVVVFGFPGHPDEILFPILTWAAVHQIDLIKGCGSQQNGLAFEAMPLDDVSYDIFVTVPLSETVHAVPREDDDPRGPGHDLTHFDDTPLPDETIQYSPLHRLYINDVLVAACDHPVD